MSAPIIAHVPISLRVCPACGKSHVWGGGGGVCMDCVDARTLKAIARFWEPCEPIEPLELTEAEIAAANETARKMVASYQRDLDDYDYRMRVEAETLREQFSPERATPWLKERTE